MAIIIDKIIEAVRKFVTLPLRLIFLFVKVIRLLRWELLGIRGNFTNRKRGLMGRIEDFLNGPSLENKVFSRIIESMPLGVLFFNAQGIVQMSNNLGLTFLRLNQEVGKEYQIVNGIQLPGGFLEPFLKPVFCGAQKNLGEDVEVAWADGKHLYRVWVERLGVESEKTEGFIVVVRDITLRRQWESVHKQGKQDELRWTPSTGQGHAIGFLR